MELGKGSFGSVKGVGRDAIKSFQGPSGLNHLVNEVFVTRYVSLHNFPNIIRLKKCNFEGLTMTTERWSCSLDVAIKRGMTSEQRKCVHLCVLRGLAYLGRSYIVNADIKPSNILVNSKCTTACIADFGISSSSGAAKVRQTSPAFTLPASKARNHRSHDLFSFVILSLHLLYGYSIPSKIIQSCAELRTLVATHVPAGIMRTTLIALSQDNGRDCWTAERALHELYGESITLPEWRIVNHYLTDSGLQSTIECNIKKLQQLFLFRRYNRCFRCSISMVSSLGLTTTRGALTYSTVMAYIFSCVFGTRESIKNDKRMSGKHVLAMTGITSGYFTSCMNTVLGDTELIKLMFAP